MTDPSRWRSRGALRAVVAVSIALAVGVGCGSDRSDGASPSTTVGQDWIDEVRRDCIALNEEYGDLATAELDDHDAAVAHARRVDEFAAELVDLFDRRTPSPSELTDQVDRLGRAASELSAAASDGDRERTEAAADRIAAAGRRLNSTTAELGVDECGGF